MKNIAIFASGNGSNFQAIADSVKKGNLRGNIALLVCDNPKAKVIQRAKRVNTGICLVRIEDFSSKDDFESYIINCLKKHKIDLIILAGFMRILSRKFVSHYKNKIINIHPSLLPAFKGAHSIKDAFNYGAKITGVTVHFVDEKIDHGPIILQEAVPIIQADTLSSLEKKIHAIEHKAYPLAISICLGNKLRIKNRKVIRKA